MALLRQAMRTARAAGADTFGIRFLAAQALLGMRRYAEAAALLGRLADERPDLDRVQLDYGAALFALGRDEEAGDVFREVWGREGLPPAVRRNVERFLERIRARRRLALDLDFGFWRDDNVNNASERETVEVPALGGLELTLNERPVRALVVRTGARLRWRRPLTASGGTWLETRAAAARNTARNASAHNRTWASVSAGPRVRYAAEIAGHRRPGLLRADAGVERRWRGGEPYAVSLWSELGAEQTLTRSLRAGFSARYWDTCHHERAEGSDPHGRSLGLHAARRIGPGLATVRGVFARETPERQDLRWRSREVWLGYAADLGRDWSLSLRAGRIGTRFDGEQPFFGVRRKDRTLKWGVTASHRAVAWKGYLPEWTFDWSRTDSNLPLYERRSRTLRLGVRRVF